MRYRNRHSNRGAGVHIFVDQGEDCAGGCNERKGWGMRQGRGGRGRGFGRGQGRGQGGRGRRRPLDHGDLRLLILKLISEAPRHGYDIIREIEARTGGAYVPSPGVIYPALEALLDLGWVEAEADGSRRSFKLSGEGRAELEAEAETLERIEQRLADLLDSDRPEDPFDVRGAMWRLRHAVREAVQAHPDDIDRRKAVADILTEAQERISKLED
ncbi:PadR family transcriptional regulator [uncultured Hyphomonas sp.]|uniref:PadR family transcriptional regulator n=1 Tax=uncultured Hyphomonas sp. TaxID=225298 RepID=UPI002AAB88FD|nr:PadR family transcriptional regulator [uncultured Hyphomonas sp.]